MSGSSNRESRSRSVDRARQRIYSDTSSRRLEANERTNNEYGDPKGMTWMITALFLIAETTSLGVLGLALAVRNLGLIAGLLVMNILYLLLWFTGFIVYQFKMRNSQIKSFAEGLVLVFGSWSHGFGVLLMVVYLLFVMAAHIVGFSLMVTTIWPNTMCNIVYKVVASLLYLVATCRRSFNAGKLIYFASCASILVAALIAMCGVGLSSSDYNTWHMFPPAGTTSLATGAEAVSYIIVASMAHIAYPTVIGEMKKPRDFPKALAFQQIFTLVFANIVVIVFYLVGGEAIESPALGPSSSVWGKAAWGLATPSIVVCGVIAAMIAAKVAYQLYWRDRINEIRNERTKRSIVSWLVITLLLNISAFLLAWGVPMFNHLFSLMGALFGTAFAMIFPALFWFHMNWKRISIAGRRWPVEPQREDSARETESAQKEAFSDVQRINTTSTTSEATDASLTRLVSSESKPRRPLLRFSREFALTVRTKPLCAIVILIILISGLTMCGLGTYGAIIGILNASIDLRALSC